MNCTNFMKLLLLSLVLAGAAMAQVKTPGTIGPVLSQPTGETIVIPFTDVQFSYTAYATAWWTQGANTGTAGACPAAPKPCEPLPRR